MLLSCQLNYLPWIIAWLYLGASLLSFTLYGIDKRAARRSNRRIAERSLHLPDLLGGWPGALIAQAAFRHKTSKRSFQFVFWLTVLLNGAAFVWMHTSGGRALLSGMLQPFQL